jgi:hypothetical protein
VCLLFFGRGCIVIFFFYHLFSSLFLVLLRFEGECFHIGLDVLARRPDYDYLPTGYDKRGLVRRVRARLHCCCSAGWASALLLG